MTGEGELSVSWSVELYCSFNCITEGQNGVQLFVRDSMYSMKVSVHKSVFLCESFLVWITIPHSGKPLLTKIDLGNGGRYERGGRER